MAPAGGSRRCGMVVAAIDVYVNVIQSPTWTCVAPRGRGATCRAAAPDRGVR